jgi:micrococcal nuclease
MMREGLLYIVLLALSSVAAAKNEYGDVSVSRVGTVIDGDSIKVDIDKWPDIVGKGITVRINGIDAPEMRGKCANEKNQARKAKQFVVQEVRSAKYVYLRNVRRGKYFRLIADMDLDGKDLGSQLLSAGLARRYEGRKRKGWCNASNND